MSDATAGTPAPRFDRRLLLGILFMCGSGALFPVMNGLVKQLSAGYESPQIVWARTLGHLIFVLLLFAPRRGIGIIRSNRLGWQVGRSLLLLVSTSCFFYAVQFVPLAKAASISFMAPLLVTVLAVPILGERIGIHRLGAVLAGLVGVLIVIRPGTEVFQWASLLILCSAACYGLYQIFTRRVAGADAPEVSVVYSALVGTLVMTCLVPFFWTTPQSLKDIAILTSLGIFGGLGHYCVAKAMTYAAANVLSPFQYFQMVGSVIVGFVMFHEVPDGYTWLGAAVIIASGLYIGWNESRKPRAA
ncbi:MAG: DMT family transporter [Rhodospirillales bacterium]|nr:DMT family transporter [Rhodospirillales bacterium]QQS12503.1 MAG: DMT family transporter [Rhodospirillales bacterium]